jgi:hypothetical protein
MWPAQCATWWNIFERLLAALVDDPPWRGGGRRKADTAVVRRRGLKSQLLAADHKT